MPDDIEPDYDAVYLEEHPELLTPEEVELAAFGDAPPPPPPPAPPMPSGGAWLSWCRTPRYGSFKWIQWNRISRAGHCSK